MSLVCATPTVSENPPVVVSLFTGAGGLDLGLEAAGFVIDSCIEINADARKTLATNRPAWILADPGNVHDINAKALIQSVRNRRGEITVLTAGPPCQPFSKSSNWCAYPMPGIRDPRAHTLDAYLRIVEAALPRVVLIENVRGIASTMSGALDMLRSAFRGINATHNTRYELQVMRVNAADYGVPQFRERIFLIATIDGQRFILPPPSHGDAAHLESYRTSWDAIGHLDQENCPDTLIPTGKWAGLLPSIPEGHNYLWHTPRSAGEPLFGWRTKYWSFLLKLAKNRSSWTIQAHPGPATGPFHWKNRLLSIREMALLQTFPDDYRFVGSRRSRHRQVGNAVPPAIGELLGLEIRRQLRGDETSRCLHFIPPKTRPIPPPEPCAAVPSKYLQFRADHPDHPGAGKGPAPLLARLASA